MSQALKKLTPSKIISNNKRSNKIIGEIKRSFSIENAVKITIKQIKKLIGMR